ncbi:unnamed protein product [Strongylus vulgaris]|uniref:Uncharacterized protein n=1 Tax=Strongylus vulgaris TaxID=40348 RepID=A0A3P7IB41_STRVU|nr:unnamed protein product [Strongylus vulgaris]
MSEEGEHRIGRFGTGFRIEEVTFSWILIFHTLFLTIHLHKKGTLEVDMEVTQRCDSCGGRPLSHQPKVAQITALQAQVQFSRKLEKKMCRRVGRRREVVYDSVRLEELLTTCDWPIEEDPTKDYDLLLEE